MKPILQKATIIIAFLFTFLSIKAQDFNIYFDFNSDIIRINDIGKLQKLKEEYNPKIHQINLIGHTDTVGNYAYNLELSKQRTLAVKKYLIKNGMDSNQIIISYKGKSQPVASDQFYNRRVEVFISEKENGEITFETFKKSLEPKFQSFTIPTNAPIEIEGNRGTLIYIPANAFITKSGKNVTGNVEIKLTEYYSMADFFSKRLSTLSNGNMLTSAGMIEIYAFQNNEELQLKENVDLELAFPKTNETPYYTFYGQRLPDGIMNWQSDKRQLAQNRESNNDDIGATFNIEGNDLIVTDKATADKRNSLIEFNPITKRFGIFSDADKTEIEKYYAKELEIQKKINNEREKYYTIIKANKLNFINCDEYIRDPNTDFVNCIISIDNPDIKLVSVFLIYRKTNSYIDFRVLDNTSAQIYARLLFNENPEIIILGIKENTPYIFHDKIQLLTEINNTYHLNPSTYSYFKSLF